jgi:uncharacterized membrane protein YagU involved in acid resistance
MRLLFLITALGEEVTPQLKRELVMYLTDTLDIILKEAGGTVGDEKRAVSSDMKITVSVSMLHVSTFSQILCVSFTLAVAVWICLVLFYYKRFGQHLILLIRGLYKC